MTTPIEQQAERIAELEADLTAFRRENTKLGRDLKAAAKTIAELEAPPKDGEVAGLTKAAAHVARYLRDYEAHGDDATTVERMSALLIRVDAARVRAETKVEAAYSDGIKQGRMKPRINGCVCTFNDADELIGMCAAHKDLIDTEKARADRLQAALTVIAAFDDMLANDSLAVHGSYSGFDEPGSVQIARQALAVLGAKP